MADFVYTVSDVNRFVQQILAGEEILSGIRVRGEISNYKVYASGHRYFSLKDEAALVRCVWFKSAQRRAADFRDGMRVVLRGDVGLYIRDGQYQITVRDMISDGSGQWYERFERLKTRLDAEGLFDPVRKKPIPAFPLRIGVVTSAHGAAVRDIIRVAQRRGSGITLVLYPVMVQGEGAAEQIAGAVRYFSGRSDVDVLIVGRGGGSIEDLWAFNEEIVARAIHECALPVISAVGHETDFTIADFVADLRAATPSAAAELAVPSREERTDRLRQYRGQLDGVMEQKLDAARQRLHTLQRMLPLAGPAMKINEGLQRLDGLSLRLDSRMMTQLRDCGQRLDAFRRIFESRDPSGVLRRGYAMIRGEDGAILGGIGSLRPDMPVRIVMADGEAGARIVGVHGKENV